MGRAIIIVLDLGWLRSRGADAETYGDGEADGRSAISPKPALRDAATATACARARFFCPILIGSALAGRWKPPPGRQGRRVSAAAEPLGPMGL